MEELSYCELVDVGMESEHIQVIAFGQVNLGHYKLVNTTKNVEYELTPMIVSGGEKIQIYTKIVIEGRFDDPDIIPDEADNEYIARISLKAKDSIWDEGDIPELVRVT